MQRCNGRCDFHIFTRALTTDDWHNNNTSTITSVSHAHRAPTSLSGFLSKLGSYFLLHSYHKDSLEVKMTNRGNKTFTSYSITMGFTIIPRCQRQKTTHYVHCIPIFCCLYFTFTLFYFNLQVTHGQTKEAPCPSTILQYCLCAPAAPPAPPAPQQSTVHKYPLVLLINVCGAERARQ